MNLTGSLLKCRKKGRELKNHRGKIDHVEIVAKICLEEREGGKESGKDV